MAAFFEVFDKNRCYLFADLWYWYQFFILLVMIWPFLALPTDATPDFIPVLDAQLICGIF
jgi:uncharacterized membrane protein YkvA (DUF1232 family)